MDEITLKNDWDYQLKLNSKKGYHITRKEEHSVLVDFLRRRNEGAMLLCGHRGVGKTSSIVAAIREIQKENQKFIPILIKATTLNFNQNNNPNNTSETLLHGLIRFLHEEIKRNKTPNKKLQKEISALYNKTLASKMYQENRVEKTNETNFGFKLEPAYMAAGGIFATSTFFVVFENISPTLGLIAGASLFTIGFIKKIASKHSIVNYYRYDYNFSDATYEFEKLMEAHSKNYKVLFVLDEFDKVDRIENIISSLKMLINQGHALFIFATDPSKINDFTKKRDSNYTLFSQILFLKRPLFKEMEAYIDSIVCNIDDCIEKCEYRDFRNYLCYKSETDFFEIKKVIRDYIIRNDRNSPIIRITLTQYQKTQANLQKSIGWIYEKKKSNLQSEQHANDYLLDCLYSAVQKMQTPNKMLNLDNDKQEITYPDGNKHIESNFSAIQDLVLILARQGYLTKIDENHYQITGNLSKFDPALGIHIEEERQLKKDYENFRARMISAANVRYKWFEQIRQPFSAHNLDSRWEEVVNVVKQSAPLTPPTLAKEYYGSIISNDYRYISVDDLQAAITEIHNAIEMIHEGKSKTLAQILEYKFDMPLIESNDISQGLFARLGISNQNIHNFSLDAENKNIHIKNIVIIYSPPIELLKQIQNKKDFYNNMIICVAPSNFFTTQRASFINQDIDSFKEWISISASTGSLDRSKSSDSKGPQDAIYEPFVFGFKTSAFPLTLKKIMPTLKHHFG